MSPTNIFQAAAIMARLPMLMTLAFSQAFARRMHELVQDAPADGARRRSSAFDSPAKTSRSATPDAAVMPRREATPSLGTKQQDGVESWDEERVEVEEHLEKQRADAVAVVSKAANASDAPAKTKRKPGRPRKSAKDSAETPTAKTAAAARKVRAKSEASGSQAKAEPKSEDKQAPRKTQETGRAEDGDHNRDAEAQIKASDSSGAKNSNPSGTSHASDNARSELFNPSDRNERTNA